MDTILLTILTAVVTALAGIIGAIAIVLGPKIGNLIGTVIDNHTAMLALRNQQRLQLAAQTGAGAAEQAAKVQAKENHPMTDPEKKAYATDVTNQIMSGSLDPDPHIEAALSPIPPTLLPETLGSMGNPNGVVLQVSVPGDKTPGDKTCTN